MPFPDVEQRVQDMVHIQTVHCILSALHTAAASNQYYSMKPGILPHPASDFLFLAGGAVFSFCSSAIFLQLSTYTSH